MDELLKQASAESAFAKVLVAETASEANAAAAKEEARAGVKEKAADGLATEDEQATATKGAANKAWKAKGAGAAVGGMNLMWRYRGCNPSPRGSGESFPVPRRLRLQDSTARPRPNSLNQELLAILAPATALEQAVVEDQVPAESRGDAKQAERRRPW